MKLDRTRRPDWLVAEQRGELAPRRSRRASEVEIVALTLVLLPVLFVLGIVIGRSPVEILEALIERRRRQG